MRGFFRDINISRKLAIVFVVMLVMMGVGGSVGIYNASQISRVTEKLYLDSFKRVELLAGVESELLAARQEIFLYAMVKDPASRDFLNIRVQERKKKIEAILTAYEAMVLTENDKALYKRLLADLQKFWSVHSVVLSITDPKERDRAIAITQMEGHKTFSTAMNTLKVLVDRSRSGALMAYERSGFFSRIIIAVTIVFTFFAIALAIGLWFVLRRSIVRPILAIEKSARSIASGDLTGRAPVMSDDEIGSLAVEFNLMSKSLQDYYSTLESRVRERTDELRGANEKLHGKQKELELANMGLIEANRMKTQFLANVSHELRTPLNSILGFSELLCEKAFGGLNDKQTQYVEYIHSSGEHLLGLINNIIDLSKIDVDKMEVIAELFPVTEALGEVLSIIRPLALEKNISIETMTVAASPKIRADKSKFKKIMLNVLTNAVKFNENGGHVKVSWTVKEETWGRDFKRFITFSIMDRGIGIKAEDMDKLFKNFEQLDSSFNREYDGSGLGLVLTKRLTELHGGTIWLESEEGKGTTVYIKLPQGTDEIELPDFADFVEGEQASGSRPLVLLGTESPDINHLIEIYLADAPYDTLAVSEGMELLNMAIDRQPFAIIMGISLPGKDGWEVLRELKAREDTAHIAVIIVSSSEDSELSLALGAEAHIGRSIDRLSLLTALDGVRSVFSNKRPLKKILLIDNSPVEIKDAVEGLESAGYIVFMSRADGEASGLVSESNPDCLVITMSAPFDESLPALVRELRGHEELRQTPFIVLVPKDHLSECKEELKAPGTHFITYDEHNLSETILSAVDNLHSIGKFIKP